KKREQEHTPVHKVPAYAQHINDMQESATHHHDDCGLFRTNLVHPCPSPRRLLAILQDSAVFFTVAMVCAIPSARVNPLGFNSCLVQRPHSSKGSGDGKHE